MSVKLEYVMSGTAYARLNHPKFINSPVSQDCFKHYLSQTVSPDHSFSVLYNALTERKFPMAYEQTGLYDIVEHVYADSGGLQAATRGIGSDEAAKLKIYKNQATHAHYGMCFDELPVGKIKGSDETTKLSNMFQVRYFDPEIFEHCALTTAKNITNQLRVFEETPNSRMKSPILIVQGNNIDHFKQWTDIVLNEIPLELHPHLTSVAISAASHGIGVLESIEQAYASTQLGMEYLDHVHFLGVGVIRRLAPALLFEHSGMYDNLRVSYDSTTHSNAPILGKFYSGGKVTAISRNYSPVYERVHAELSKTYPLPYDAIQLYKYLNMSVTECFETEGNADNMLLAVTSLMMNGLMNFYTEVETIRKDRNALFKVFGKNAACFDALLEVKGIDDFSRWRGEYGKYLQSKHIQYGEPVALDI